MHSDLVELGWTEEHFNRIDAVVTEEAQKARAAAQLVSIVAAADSATVAVPGYQIGRQANPALVPSRTAPQRLTINTDPSLFLTKIAVNVAIRSRDAADSNLEAVLTMFRRAANYVARIEDALVFNGRPGAKFPPPFGIGGIPAIYNVSGNGLNEGIFPVLTPAGARRFIPLRAVPQALLGNEVVTAVSRSIGALEASGHFGPYACALSARLFDAICTPNANLVLPRDRILPFLQGPLLRSSAILPGWGVVVALSASPVELVVASDIQLRYLQTTEEPRLIFQVAERVALRVKESAAIALLF